MNRKATAISLILVLLIAAASAMIPAPIAGGGDYDSGDDTSSDTTEDWSGGPDTSDDDDAEWTGGEDTSDDDNAQWTGGTDTSDDDDAEWTGGEDTSDDDNAQWTGGTDTNDGGPNAPNSAPAVMISFNPQNPEPGDSVSFDGSSSSDSDGSIESYDWSGAFEATGSEVSHSFSSEGSYTVTLKVTDDDGATDSQTVTVQVEEQTINKEDDDDNNNNDNDDDEDDEDDWNLDADFDVGTDNPLVGKTLTFNAGSTQISGGEIESYYWNWDSDSESEAEGQLVETTFSEAGEYEVSVKVVTKNGSTDIHTETVEVKYQTEDSNQEFDVEAGVPVKVESVEGSVSSVLFIPASDASDVVFESGVLDSNPEASNPDGSVYQYLSLNLIGVEPSGSSRMEFEVPQDAYEEGDSVTMHRYSDGWNGLNSNFISQDSDLLYFWTQTPGFSTFAVTVGDEDSDEDDDDSDDDNDDSDGGSSYSGGGGVVVASTDKLSMSVSPDEIDSGQFVSVRGYTDKGDSKVEIRLEGEKVAEVTSRPDGYYSTSLQVNQTGNQTVKALSNGAEETATLQVNPTVEITSMTSPEQVDAGTQFEVCVTVDSQVDTYVRLFQDGNSVAGETVSDTHCFNRNITEEGSHNFRAVATVRGNRDEAETETYVGEVEETETPDSSTPGPTGSFFSGASDPVLTLVASLIGGLLIAAGIMRRSGTTIDDVKTYLKVRAGRIRR